MQIKRATQKESKILAQLFSILYKAELRWSEEKISDNINQNKKEYYIDFVDEKPKGALSLKFNLESCELEAIVIQNQRQQNGSRLLKFAEELARERRCKKIWCYSLERYNIGDFYVNNGWIKEKFIPNFWDRQNCFKYSKPLDRTHN